MRATLHPASGASAALPALPTNQALPPRAPRHARKPARSAHRLDALIVATVTLATWVLCGLFNVTELLRRLTAPYERFQLDELPSVLLVLGLGLTWFATRRYAEARQDIARRNSAERQLAEALANNRRLAQQYLELQEAERKTLARELHDELGQHLNVIKIDAVGIRDTRRVELQAMRERASAIADNCDHVHRALATLIRELRPAGLDELGLEAALEHCVQTWRTRLPKVALRLSVTADLAALPEGLAVTVYRLIQEALTNVAKHSRAAHVTIHLDRAGSPGEPDDTITVTAEDDGLGTDPALATRGLGLIGMRERVRALGGEFSIRSAPARGFKLTARMPVCSPSMHVS